MNKIHIFETVTEILYAVGLARLLGGPWSAVRRIVCQGRTQWGIKGFVPQSCQNMLLS